MKNENRFAPITITKSRPDTTTVFSIAVSTSRSESRRPSTPSTMAPNAPIEAASVGLKMPA